MRNQKIHKLLTELNSIAPLPKDEDLDGDRGQKLLQQYERIISELEDELKIHDVSQLDSGDLYDIISSLLASFSIGDGYGVYWETLHILESLGDVIYTFIYLSIENSINPGTRGWCCYLLGRRRNIIDLSYLLRCLKDSDHFVQKQALLAIYMLSQKNNVSDAISSIEALSLSDDLEIQSEAQNVLRDIFHHDK